MNSIFLDLGPVKIYWYSILLLFAFIIGGAIAFREAKKNNISDGFMTNYFFYLIPLSIIGARIYYILFNLDYYSMYPLDMIKIWEGGLAIHGGIFIGIIFTFLYTKKYKIRFLRMLDICVVSLLIGQAIGRWGNFMNGEAYGPITTLSHLENLHLPKFIIEGMNIGGVYHTPTFLYESLWCLIGFIILLFVRRIPKLKVGWLTSFYLLWYGSERFIVEGLRQDSLMLGSFKMAQIISILMICGGIFLTLYSFRNNLYNESEENLSGRI